MASPSTDGGRTKASVGRTVAGALVALSVLGAAAVGSAAGAPASGDAAETRSSPAFVVAVHENGSATVSVVYTFDLTTEAEAAAFEQVRTDETLVAGYERRTTERLGRVADAASTATGREMRVTAATATVERADSTGVVALSATWTRLAAVDGDRLVVTEPFASGFDPDRPFVVVPPEGHALADTTVAPTAVDDGAVTWAPGTDLTGFEAVLAPDEDVDGTPTTGSAGGAGDGDSSDDSDGGQSQGASATGPGFGVAVAVGALLAVALGRVVSRAR